MAYQIAIIDLQEYSQEFLLPEEYLKKILEAIKLEI